jgi:4-diphosphocytidyl-2-C-methyl-D-erythritol kinase
MPPSAALAPMAELRLDRQFRLRAPAKINLGLEITGKRTDGYHEIITILQAIDLCDEIELTPAEHFNYQPDSRIPASDDLILRALDLVRERFGLTLRARLRVVKRIPISAGLGGGSSDAGTLLAVIGELAGIPQSDLLVAAAELGSDVPFFVHGGTALATGTGTDLEPLPLPNAPFSLVLVVPDVQIPQKTAALYASLSANDFSDGASTRRLAEQIRRGDQVDNTLLRNAFARALYTYPAIAAAREALLQAGASAVLPSGAGPSLIGIFPDKGSTDAALTDWPSDRRFLPRLVAALR